MARKLPVDTQSFETLRNDGYIYVDKTQYLQKMLERGRVFFLSRPRRFGKSLFVSMLESYFTGRRELFKGLAIEQYEDKKGNEGWQNYPLISFRLSGGSFKDNTGLEDMLDDVLVRCQEKYDLTGEYKVIGETLPRRFKNTIERLYDKTGKRVVVIVDEYDNPILKAVGTEQEKKNRDIYKSFFSVLKDQDDYLKFVFFTGVTKFSKVSIFSDLNQLKDISMLDEFSGICGFSEEEVLDSFGPEIEAMAHKQKMTYQYCVNELHRMYDGYHFSKVSDGMYNPYSLLNALQDKEFNNYWFESATPGFMIHKLEKSSFRPEQFDSGIETDEAELKDYRTDNPNPVPIFYQTGYLTIEKYDKRFRVYTLGFPNEEVKYGFLKSLVSSSKRNIDDWKAVVAE